MKEAKSGRKIDSREEGISMKYEISMKEKRKKGEKEEEKKKEIKM